MYDKINFVAQLGQVTGTKMNENLRSSFSALGEFELFGANCNHNSV